MKDSFVAVALGGTQHIVRVGDEVIVNRLDGKVGDILQIEEVLLHQDDKKTTIGTPYTGHVVKAKIDRHFMGPKMHIRTYKAKARTRKKIGHRQSLTSIIVTDIARKRAASAK